jgi:hypothetical protein
VSGSSALFAFTTVKNQVIMEEATKPVEEEIKLHEFRVRIRGNKLNRDPFVEVFIVNAKNKRDASREVDKIMRDTSPQSILYKYGVCEERFTADIEPIF